MNVRISRLILTLAIISLLPMTLITYVPSALAPTRITFGTPPAPGGDSFAEDFTTTTYEDGATTADGWGTGTVTCARDYTITQLDFFSTTNPVYDVDVQGRTAFVTCYNPTVSTDTLYLLNIVDPSNIRSYGSRDSSIMLASGKIHGDIYYSGRQYGSNPAINVFNITNPYDIDVATYLGNILLDGAVSDIEVQGHFLYAADYGSTSNRAFIVIDVEDPDNPEIIPNDWITQNILGLEIHGQIAYLAHAHNGLYMLNISNPYDIDMLSEIGHLNTFGNATDVIVDGTIAYVADGPDGVQIIDVSNPVLPVSLGEINTPGNARRLALQGKTLFVADETGGVRILDVSMPTNPREVVSIATPFTRDVDLYGGDLVVATDSGVYTYRVGAGLTDLPLFGTYAGFDAWDVRVRGDIAYVAAGSDGFLTLDVSNPTSPQLLDQYNPGVSQIVKLDVQGHLATCFDYQIGGTFFVFDISDPSNIKVTDTLGAGNCIDVFMHGEVVFYSFHTGFGAVNISDPYNVAVIFNWNGVTTNTTALWAQGNHLYLVDDLGGMGTGFYIYSILDISNPTLLGSFSLQSFHWDIFVDGDVAYGANKNWFYTGNLTDPTSIYFPDTIYTSAHPSLGTWGFGPYAVSARGTGGVRIVNTTVINDVNVIATFDAATGATHVTVHGDYAYVANRTSLLIFRLFQSAGNTYATSSVAQSTEVDTTDQLIKKATLSRTAFFPTGTNMNFEMSADGGAHWESVTVGVEHTFANPGNDLRWRATLLTTFSDRYPSLTQVSIDYVFNDPPTAPTLNDPGTMHTTGEANVVWVASTDSDGTVDHYELQMSDSNTFSAILDSWTPTGTSQPVTGLTSNTYYFRVRAIDNDGAASSWSNIEDIIIALPIPPPPNPFLLIAIAVIIIVVVIIVIFLLLRRRSGEPK